MSNLNFVLQVTQNAFKSLIQFLYTGRLETNIMDCDIVLRLADQCQLPKLRTELEDQIKKVTAFGKWLLRPTMQGPLHSLDDEAIL